MFINCSTVFFIPMTDIQENIHGNKKRLAYAESLLRERKPTTVLDVGCGNGIYLTIPLAERFPETQFWGVDSDATTIEAAQAQTTLPNLHFRVDAEIPATQTFDVIIASEVIEHVEHPGAFLLFLRSKLQAGGSMFITTPNGYGCFEIMTALETALHLLGVMTLLSKVPFLHSFKVGIGYDTDNISAMQHDTLAISPHVNFFSYKRLRKLFSEAGFRVVAYRPRSLFGGIGFQQLMKRKSVLEWNARTADRMPPHVVSGWMFVVEVQGEPVGEFSYRRRINERVRRYFTAKRWGTRRE